MRASKICFGIMIGFIVGLIGFIALGSVLSSFSIPKPAEIYRAAREKSLIQSFLIFYPVAFLIGGSLTGGCLAAYLTRRKPKRVIENHESKEA